MVKLGKIDSTATITDVMHLQQFLATINRYEEGGFEWPKPLMDARNLEELRERLAILEQAEQPIAEKLAKGYVPQEVFWIYNRHDRIVGMLKIRTMLTSALLREGGHIGCGISPAHRQHGYATAALQKAVSYCIEQHRLHDILLTIKRDNVASRRVIEQAGGTLWDVINDPNQPGAEICRYWIRC